MCPQEPLSNFSYVCPFLLHGKVVNCDLLILVNNINSNKLLELLSLVCYKLCIRLARMVHSGHGREHCSISTKVHVICVKSTEIGRILGLLAVGEVQEPFSV